MAIIKKKKTRELQKEIQWFLDFINIKDIKNLSKSDRAELASVIQTYTHYQKLGGHQDSEPIDPSFMEHLVGLIDPERLASFQKRIGDFFGFMTTRVKYTFYIGEKGWTSPENTDFYPDLNKETIETTYSLRVDGLRYEANQKNGRATEYRLITESLNEATIATTYDSSIEEHFFLYSFINLIDGVSIVDFKECTGCGKWFVNLTKRQRIFCTNSCGARKIGREKRAESKKKREVGDLEEIKKYKKELKEGRIRAKRWYRKQKLGNKT